MIFSENRHPLFGIMLLGGDRGANFQQSRLPFPMHVRVRMTVRRRIRMGVDLIAELDRHDEDAPMPHPALGNHMIGKRLHVAGSPFQDGNLHAALVIEMEVERRASGVRVASITQGARRGIESFCRTVVFAPYSPCEQSVTLGPMYRTIRRALVVLIALGFAAGGIARAALTFTPGEPCHSTSHQHASENVGHAHHDHADPAVAHHDHGSSNQPAPAGACFKCCGVCTASSNFTGVAGSGQIVFMGRPIAYSFSANDRAGRTVPIDPGIPKRMA